MKNEQSIKEYLACADEKEKNNQEHFDAHVQAYLREKEASEDKNHACGLDHQVNAQYELNTLHRMREQNAALTVPENVEIPANRHHFNADEQEKTEEYVIAKSVASNNNMMEMMLLLSLLDNGPAPMLFGGPLGFSPIGGLGNPFSGLGFSSDSDSESEEELSRESKDNLESSDVSSDDSSYESDSKESPARPSSPRLK